MNYRIALLTHGADGTPAEALDSFLDGLSPAPTDVYAYGDGPGTEGPLQRAQMLCARRDVPFTAFIGPTHRGYCNATADLWKRASTTPRLDNPLKLSDHVFWLEHDFRLLRPLDLTPLGSVLAQHAIYGGDPVCQVSLMRNAVNEEERIAGGLFELRQGDFFDEGRWLSQRSYFTTNPSLMTVDFMLREHFPGDVSRACEGRFSLDLFGRGYRAGVWGDGEPWVEHVGQRTGIGY